jgi:hypothetical protein
VKRRQGSPRQCGDSTRPRRRRVIPAPVTCRGTAAGGDRGRVPPSRSLRLSWSVLEVSTYGSIYMDPPPDRRLRQPGHGPPAGPAP